MVERLKIKALPPFAELHKVRSGNCKIFIILKLLKKITEKNEPKADRNLQTLGVSCFSIK